MIKLKKCPSADLRQSSIKLRSCDENRMPLVTKLAVNTGCQVLIYAIS